MIKKLTVPQKMLQFSMLLFFFGYSPTIQARQFYRISGVLKEVSPELVLSDAEGKQFIFKEIPRSPVLARVAHVGDWVTIWYTVKTEKIVIESLEKSRVGSSENSSHPSQNRPEGNLILDDRVFYDAKNGDFKDCVALSVSNSKDNLI